MAEPSEILNDALKRASSATQSAINDAEVQQKINSVCRNTQNRACVRVLLAGSLAKIHTPNIDIRKPYTEIVGDDVYSGRRYDEEFITDFINEHNLPCNPTTAFLTPALRNRNQTLTPEIDLEGKPKAVYSAMISLLNDVYKGKLSADQLLVETVRCLLAYRDERASRLRSLIDEIKTTTESDGAPLSAEGIVTLIKQHLQSPRSSRLPVLVVAAAYQAAENHLGERILPLHTHTSADLQTGALGDLEITLQADSNIVTTYEMKMKRVLISDIENAIEKVRRSQHHIDNYIFITTDVIEIEVQEYAKSLYDNTGIEFVILDCVGFLRHYLHLFHRLRMTFLDTYQDLLLEEPESSVHQDLKETFLSLRKAAETKES